MSRYRIAVHITPRRGILDPQGKTVADALHTLGFAGVRDVHVGRHIVVEIDAGRPQGGRAVDARDVRATAGESGHRRFRDREQRGGLTMKFGIVTFPGSNCDYDAYRPSSTSWAKRRFTSGTRITTSSRATSIILPGGFSYGDYLRAGAIARFSPVMQDVDRVREARRPGHRDLQRFSDRLRGGTASRARSCATRA